MTVDPRFLPHRTPTQIAEATFEASRARARRKPGPGGMPKPEHVFNPRNERDLLLSIVQEAWKAHIAEVTPPDWRDRVAAMLVDELERIYPAADMAVLERYDVHAVGRSIVVSVGLLMHEFPLASPRPVPRNAALAGGQVPFFLGDGRARAVPQAAEPYFEALRLAHARKYEEFDRAAAWAGAQAAQKRAPTWTEIEETFPRIGAWIAAKRESA